MKIAGQKNDGAWFRFNLAMKTIRQASSEGALESLRTKIKNLPGIVAYLASLTDIATLAGVGLDEHLGSADTFATQLVTIGIPRQVWMGHLTFTIYEKQEPDENGKVRYKGVGQSQAHAFAKQLRKACIQWLKAQRQLSDVGNIGDIDSGNPGGLPDATPHT